MQRLLNIVLLVYPIFLFIHSAKAETYFLKIAQEEVSNQETFLQTCSARTDPRIIKVYVPIPPEKKPAKNDTVLKYSEKVIASFKVQAIKAKDLE